jgi:hypothetical protein
MRNTSEFSDYRNEYMTIGVGPIIYGMICQLVAETIQHYPPSVYSINKIWDDDAVSGICNDFIIEKLLRKGWLEYYFLSLDTTKGLINVLRRDFRHFLISKRIY